MSSGDSWLDALAALAGDHLWQSTLVAAIAAILGLCLRRYSARVRHAIYLAASIKFLLPFSLLTAVGSLAPWPAPALTDTPVVVTTVWELGRPFAQPAVESALAAPPMPSSSQRQPPQLTVFLFATWLAGIVVMTGRWLRGARLARSARQSSRPIGQGREMAALARVGGTPARTNVTLRSLARRSSPCVVGIVRPVLLWPDGISDDLSDTQLEAILRHELSHVRRRDNLASLIHATVEIMFWFHPVVWWLGARLVAERERACDENVLAAGAAPIDYARAILAICERSIGSEVLGAAGIGGSVLVRRMEVIMSAAIPKSPGRFVRAGLGLVAVALVAGPLAVGAATAQGAAPGGRITGVVTDQFGGAVPGATVTVAGNAASATRTVDTDASGRYTLADLPAGTHELRVTLDGFRPHVVAVTVGAGSQVTADARLRLGSVSESVTLAAALGGASPGPRPSASDAEAALARQLAERPDDVDAQLGLAELLYKDERFAESAVAMEHASALWAASQRPSSSPVAANSTGDITPPKPVRRVNPIYPESARAAGVTGMIILEGTITEDGTVQDLRVIRSVPMLDDAAIGAVRQWLYEPTRLNGVPVAVVMTTTIRFSAD